MPKILLWIGVVFSCAFWAYAEPVQEELTFLKSLTNEQIEVLTESEEVCENLRKKHNAERIIEYLHPELSSVGIDPAFVRKYFDLIFNRFCYEYFKKESYKVTSLLTRVDRFFPFYHREFKKHGLPKEYAAISLIESWLIPDIKSKAGAVGLWQFIPGTASLFKIYTKTPTKKRDRRGRWIYQVTDSRVNVHASTDAAIRFIQYQLKSIRSKKIPRHLEALALLVSYNAGMGRVNNLLEKCAPGDLFVKCDISILPQETQTYLMRFIGALYFLKTHMGFSQFAARDTELYPCIRRHEYALTPEEAETFALDKQINLTTFYYYNKNPVNNIYAIPHEKYNYGDSASGCETPEEYAEKTRMPKFTKLATLNYLHVTSQQESHTNLLAGFDKKKRKRLKKLQK